MPLPIAAAGARMGLTVEAFPVPGKVALYLENPAAGPDLGTREGDTIGLRISEPATGAAFHYIPGCAAVDGALAARLKDAPLVFFDGTLYDDGEMIAQGLSSKTGRRMGHISMSGPAGTLAAFRGLGVQRRIFVHINNSNPILRENSAERRAVEAAGWEVAFDGMEISL
jgi:pyrroloquinoline quinone biosynthesis protein B